MRSRLAVAAALAASGPASAAVIYAENFDAYAPTPGFTAFALPGAVGGGSVDVVASGSGGITCAGGRGNCLDLGGSLGVGGTFSFTARLTPGLYRLAFMASGDQRGGSAEVLLTEIDRDFLSANAAARLADAATRVSDVADRLRTSLDALGLPSDSGIGEFVDEADARADLLAGLERNFGLGADGADEAVRAYARAVVEGEQLRPVARRALPPEVARTFDEFVDRVTDAAARARELRSPNIITLASDTPFGQTELVGFFARPGEKTFRFSTDSTDNSGPILDNIVLARIDPVSEPAAFTILGFGLAALARRRR